jgi:hypothetical protein
MSCSYTIKHSVAMFGWHKIKFALKNPALVFKQDLTWCLEVNNKCLWVFYHNYDVGVNSSKANERNKIYHHGRWAIAMVHSRTLGLQRGFGFQTQLCGKWNSYQPSTNELDLGIPIAFQIGSVIVFQKKKKKTKSSIKIRISIRLNRSIELNMAWFATHLDN